MSLKATKPCPFCGSKRQELRECAGYAMVFCKRCGASGQMAVGPHQAIEAWNERTEDGTSRGNMLDDVVVGNRWPVDYTVTRIELSHSK